MGVSAGGGALIPSIASLEGACCLVAARTRREELNKGRATEVTPTRGVRWGDIYRWQFIVGNAEHTDIYPHATHPLEDH